MLAKTDTRAARREAMVEKILKAAWRLARRDGLAALSLRDLAKAVGMRAPSLYSYFDSKHAIYDAMFAQANRQLIEECRVTGAPDFEVFIKEQMRALWAFSKADPTRHALLFQRVIPGFEPSPESFAIAKEALGNLQQEFANSGIDDRAAVDLFTAISSGLVNQQLANEPDGDRWERLSDEAMEMFLDHIGYERKGKKR